MDKIVKCVTNNHRLKDLEYYPDIVCGGVYNAHIKIGSPYWTVVGHIIHKKHFIDLLKLRKEKLERILNG